MTPTPASRSDRAVRAVRDRLAEHLTRQSRLLEAIAPEVGIMSSRLEGYLEGGKMLRPLFCYWGGVCAIDGDAGQDGVLTRQAEEDLSHAGAAIELVQAAALLHDDVIDHSPTRRGRAAEHVAAADRHRLAGMSGSATDFGEAFAIVLGDLALSWSEQIFARVDGRDDAAGARGRDEFDALRTEVMCGQYLDILHQTGGFRSAGSIEEAAMSVIRWKTVPYTVSRPLRMGAALCGADDSRLDLLDAWAEVTGTAFQLRDDLLSVVGTSDATGKPIGGDITEGKRTVILARALEAADAPQRRILEEAVGVADAPEGAVRRAHEVLRETGAVASVAQDVRDLARRGAEILAGDSTLPPSGREGLSALARAATDLEELPVD